MGGEAIIVSGTNDDFASTTSQNSIWIIDSTASHHIIVRWELLLFYRSGDFRIVKMGNDIYKKNRLRQQSRSNG